MDKSSYFITETKKAFNIYWELAKIIVPILFLTQILQLFGLIDIISPWLNPVMNIYDLAPTFAIAWMSGLLVGVWGGIVVVFALIPISEISVADMTVFSALLLFAHGLPIEQRIIQKTGSGFFVTCFLRIGGGMLYAWILHQIFIQMDLFSQPINPAWIPSSESVNWTSFLISLCKSMFWMFVTLFVLIWVLEFLKWTKIIDWLMKSVQPLFRIAGIKEEAGEIVSVGLMLGIMYGGGLLIQKSKTDSISPRQIFLSCVFIGFAHSIVEDTLIVVTLGADWVSILIGRVCFTVLATGLVAVMLKFTSDKWFNRYAFNAKSEG